MKKNSLFISVFLLFYLLISVSCNGIINKEESCVLNFYADVENRTAFPVVQNIDFNKIALYGKMQDKSESMQLINIYDSISELEKANEVIECGIWDFKLTAYINSNKSEDGTIYSCSIENKEIKRGLNILRFDLELESYDLENGKGTINLELTFDEDVPVRKVTAKLSDMNENGENTVFAEEELNVYAKEDEWLKAVCYQKINVPAGLYKAEFVFYGDSEKKVIINEFSESCYVVKNLLTKKSISINLFEDIYSVSYNLNGGSLKEDVYVQTSFSRKNEFPLPSESEVYKRGYVFDGWYEKADLSGNALTEIHKSTTENIELFAKWIPKKYMVTLKERNNKEITGTNLVSTSIEHTYGTETELPVLEKYGYNFRGWYLDELCQRDTYTTVAQNAIVKDTVYYALFEPKEYSIVYLNEGASSFTGTLPEYAPQIHYYSITTDFVSPYNSERSFVGWFSDPLCTEPVVSIDGFKEISGNKIYVYAKWEESISAYVSELDQKLTEIDMPENYSKVYTINIKNPDIDGTVADQKLIDVLNKHYNLTIRLNFTLLNCIKNIDFSGLTNIISVKFPQNVTYDKFMFTGCTHLESVDLPENVTRIEDNAFLGCSSLESFNFREGIVSIGSNAFKNCSKLFEIHLPDTLTSLGDYAFTGCINHNVIKDKTGEVYTKSSFLNVFEFIKEDLLTDVTVEINESENSISDNEFRNWKSLIKISIHDNVASIGNNAFDGCIKLSDVSLPVNLTSLGEYAFYNCSEIKSVTIPSGVTVLNNNTFNGCIKLQTAELHANITSLGVGVFNNCKALEKIDIPKKATVIGTQCFINCEKLSEVKFDSGSELAKIESYAFSGCASITSLDIPDTVQEIGVYAFSLCKILTQVKLPSALKIISSNMFNQCSSLTEIDLPETVESVKECAFQSCTSLKKLVLKSNVTLIEGNMVSGCTSLSEIEIHTSVEDNENQKYRIEIKDNAFAACKSGCIINLFGDQDKWKDIQENLISKYGGNVIVRLTDN